MINPCEFLAGIGWEFMRGMPIKESLMTAPREWEHRDGAWWFMPITWPDRVPALKTWAGQLTLTKLIKKYQKVLENIPEEEFLYHECAIGGISGMDPLRYIGAIDAGFSLNSLEMKTIQKPGMELLAIVGLETLPLVSISRDMAGFIYEGRIYEIKIKKRDGGYLSHWDYIE